MGGQVRRFQRLDLLLNQHEPLVLAPELVCQIWRQCMPVAGAHLLERRQEARLQRHDVADALTLQQPLDPVGVHGALGH